MSERARMALGRRLQGARVSLGADGSCMHELELAGEWSLTDPKSSGWVEDAPIERRADSSSRRRIDRIIPFVRTHTTHCAQKMIRWKMDMSLTLRKLPRNLIGRSSARKGIAGVRKLPDMIVHDQVDGKK